MQNTTLNVEGIPVPVTAVNTAILGAGGAGMNCALQLVAQWRKQGIENPGERLAVVTGGLKLGASRMSGSDKQTYYKMGTSPRIPDTAEDFAKTLTAFGCCNGDTALVEGICSLKGFYNLVEVGVPFPHDPFGAFIGYKTDHDPYERATSAGPKTSKFMSECLEAHVRRAGVSILDNRPVAALLTRGEGEQKRIVSMLCFDLHRLSDSDLGLHAFVAENWVLAAGGPGEIYETTVYPRGQYGMHGAALQAGLVAANLTESQFGLASTKFRWNVSGTYMQVVPRIYSTDADGNDPREFLTEYFDDMPSMATNIFLKGYQWPFDAQRITEHQSSLVDMAVHQETVVRGRRVWMDFLRNPVGAEGWDEYDPNAMGQEAREYLEKTGATQATPIERLAHMNPPAIEIYAENDIDLHSEPLEIAVCAQHMNGGFAVNKWWESNVPHVFVVGEMAGTHGVKRPGGSALNAGQVGAARAAEYIAHAYSPAAELADVKARRDDLLAALAGAVAEVRKVRKQGEAAEQTPAEALAEIGRRMTRCGAHLRSKPAAAEAYKQAVAQCNALAETGLRIDKPADLRQAFGVRQQCLTHAAILKAICELFDRGAGSRGSHCILDPEGTEMHPDLVDPETGKPYRCKPDNEDLRQEILLVGLAAALGNEVDPDDPFCAKTEAPRPIPDRRIAFEPAWTEYRTGRIYKV